MVTLLVTGGAGYIGSHVARAAVGRGYRVLIFDKESPTPDRLVEGASYIRGDIRDRAAVFQVFRRFEIGAVSHHAALISVPESIRDPVLDAQTNLIGSINLLDACEEGGCGTFVFASSGGAIYGEPPYGRPDEAGTVSPVSPYGAHKFAFETILATTGVARGIRGVSLRYSNVYGPGQTQGVVATFERARRAGEPVQIFGNTVRDFVHVTDAVAANLAALNGETGPVMNVCTGIGTSIGSLAGRMGLTVELRDARRGDVVRSVMYPGDFIDRIGEPMCLEDGLLTLR